MITKYLTQVFTRAAFKHLLIHDTIGATTLNQLSWVKSSQGVGEVNGDSKGG